MELLYRSLLRRRVRRFAEPLTKRVVWLTVVGPCTITTRSFVTFAGSRSISIVYQSRNLHVPTLTGRSVRHPQFPEVAGFQFGCGLVAGAGDRRQYRHLHAGRSTDPAAAAGAASG